MDFDIVIANGTVVDGTGRAPFAADVGLSGGRIAAVGQGLGAGERVIDATGRIVTPGFVDLHTHFDAQVGWDPMLTPSSLHGVTTAVIGNCGMAFAPVRPGDNASLAGMMEAVEDIPAAAILSGLPWDWETYGEYLDSVERLRPAINVAGFVGHTALRRYVMGDDAVDGHPDEAGRARLASLTADARAGGAVGFSTSRFLDHKLPDGRRVPGTFAGIEELTAITGAVADGGILQVVVNEQSFRSEIALITDVLQGTGARLLLLVGVGETPKSGASVRRLMDQFAENGINATAMIAPRSGGIIAGLSGSVLPWRTKLWGPLHRATLAQRLEALRDPVSRRLLIAEGEANEPFLAAELFFPLDSNAPDYTASAGSLAELAADAGESAAAYFVRVSLETDGRALFTGRTFNRCYEAVAAALEHPRVLPGLGDAGAHVGQVMDAGWTTFWLQHWVRDTATFDIAEGVRRITSAPADVIGFDDVGRIGVGCRADINVIDLAGVTPLGVEYVYDFPGGAGRFVQQARGYDATIVNGVVVAEAGQLTGARSGAVLRAGRAA